MSENKFLKLYAVGDMRLESGPMPQPRENDLLIRPHTTGICGSDQHLYKEGHIGTFELEDPLVLGHECSGIVVAVGNNVKEFSVGDRVALEPPISCWKCTKCKDGRYNMCRAACCLATPPCNGTFTNYIAHPSEACYKLPESVSLEEGAMMEPLSVAVQSAKRARLHLGQNVLVLGAGPIGMMHVLIAKAAGAPHIIVTDLNTERLKIMEDLGATLTINIRGKSNHEVKNEVLKLLNGRLVDVSFDCVGIQSTLDTALECTDNGGTVTMVGIGPNRAEFALFDLISREVDLVAAFRFCNAMDRAIELVETGRVDLSKITKVHYPMEQHKEAFERAALGDVGKVFIDNSVTGEDDAAHCTAF